MNCPFCSNVETKVLDKRVSDPKANRRRRECQKCHKRFTTYEKVDKLITKVRKRDGTEVDFEPDKIANAIWKAAQSVGGTDKEMAKALSDKVVDALEDRFGGTTTPTIEQIQDIVEKVLVDNGHYKTSKAYILYRKQHEKIREAKTLMVDVTNTIGEYLNRTDWRVKENANEAFSFSGLLLHTAGKVMSNYNLNELFPPEVSNAHKMGYIHIHDLSHGVIGYCCGHSLKNILLWGFGGVPNKVDCKPAKHLSTVVHQLVNYIGCLQMEFAGAQAVSSFDTLLAPFVRADNLTYKQVKQNMQQLVFSLNIPSRWGCFSDDTEILTADGWKKGTDLNVGETIATFNTKTEEIEYLPVQRMTKDHYKGKMYRLKNRIMDQLVTPNHRVLRRIHNYQEGVSPSKYVFEEAQKLKTRIPLIPLSGKFKGTEGLDMSKDLVNSLSWIVSEGSLCRSERIGITQSAEKNPEKCDDIRNALNGAGFPFDEMPKLSGFTGKKNCLRFRINRPMSRRIHNMYFPNYVKRIPNEIKNLPTPLAREFIETYMKADGWPDENKIYTKKDDVDALQEIIVKAGWGSTVLKNKNGIYVVRIIKHDYSQVTSIDQEDYDGIVWCPTTTNGTVIVRRKGKVFISGNSQYPFSNITFDWVVPEDMKKEKAIVGGKQQDYTYADVQKEMDMINKAFIEVMVEGDANGSVFSFPIPTYNITKNFNWDSENAKLLFDMTAKFGLPYFQNYIGSNLDPKSIRAMCCRLNINQNELLKRPGGMWGPGDSTGSIGVVTLNVNRLAYEAKKDTESPVEAKNLFFNKIKQYMNLGKTSLEIKREVIEKNLKNGLMPFTKRYLGTFNNHFSTIGLCGMNEACRNLLGKDIATPEGKQLAIDTLKFMSDMCLQFQKDSGNLYNLEATPAEGASYRLAREDKKAYPDIITAGKEEPYLTNSTQLPVDFSDDAICAIEHQNDLQHIYTGGTIFHTFLGEKLSNGDSCKNLVRKIAENTKLPYFSITPTFSVCPDHGYVQGEHFNCPMHNGENKKDIVTITTNNANDTTCQVTVDTSSNQK
jgi:ribonucleoside-triphosphate reductase